MLPVSACESNRQSELKVVSKDDHTGLLVASEIARNHMRYRYNVCIFPTRDPVYNTSMAGLREGDPVTNYSNFKEMFDKSETWEYD